MKVREYGFESCISGCPEIITTDNYHLRKYSLFVCCRLSELEQKRNEIYDRLGRHEQFGTKEERDAWLQNELEYVLCIMIGINLS